MAIKIFIYWNNIIQVSPRDQVVLKTKACENFDAAVEKKRRDITVKDSSTDA